MSTTNSGSPSLENTNSEEIGLKPTKDDRKKFDLDLAYGQLHEDEFLDILRNKKVEVKTERGDYSNPRSWVNTGNIAVEFQSYGKPSGISATESDFWCHNLAIGDDVYCRLLFSVDNLKKIVNNLDFHRVVNGGDNYASRMYLLNLSKLFSTDTVKLYRNIST